MTCPAPLNRFPGTWRARPRLGAAGEDRFLDIPRTRPRLGAAGEDLEGPGMERKKKAYVETYGCQMNISDGELMSGILASRGYELVPAPEEADVILVNTCAIREHAEQRVLGRVAQLGG